MNSLTPTEYDAAIATILNDAGVPAELQPAIRRGIDRACMWHGELDGGHIRIATAYLRPDSHGDLPRQAAKWLDLRLSVANQIAAAVEAIRP